MSNNIQDQELDLTQIGQGIKNFFNNIVNKCFDFLFFIIRQGRASRNPALTKKTSSQEKNNERKTTTTTTIIK